MLTTLPDEIGNLTNLNELWLYENELTILPESFGNLTNLTKLDLGCNQTITLPESFENLTNLTVLPVLRISSPHSDWIGNLTTSLIWV